ncbi:hypothetical protein BDZ89DRAFT_1072008, partial [Hymenopellis radicata]
MPLFYEPPSTASPAHKTFAAYINGWDGMNIDAVTSTFDDEAFEWTILPTTLNIPGPLTKAQALAYIKDVLSPIIIAWKFHVLSVTEPNENMIISHVKSQAFMNPDLRLDREEFKNEYLIVMTFVPSKVAGELPKIANYTEFMDSQVMAEFRKMMEESEANK